MSRMFGFGILLLLVMAVIADPDNTTEIADIDEKCLHCICNVESGCRPLGCHMDVGSLSCGYYQIKESYWTDCGKPGGSLEACGKDKACSDQCVHAYMRRYGTFCTGGRAPTCEDYARIHNGGPYGCRESATIPYWNKVRACYVLATTIFADIDDKCLGCICKIESNCQPLGCHMDVGSLSCGYYQIKDSYWTDCGKPGSDLEVCGKNKSCSDQCVHSYMRRYGTFCTGGRAPTCEDYARIHNGGPLGCRESATIPYWNRVAACYNFE